ncbi:MAG TPA: Maf family protein, partial [Burkholderiales bacterium]|nr:Maf family protein [Burkholderiales bacterium]
MKSLVLSKNIPLKLVLASTSVYRRMLLEKLRIPFAVDRPEVDETALPGEAPADLALRLSRAKAAA